MKINGRKISGPNVEVIVIPRLEGDIIFKAQAILSFKEFETLCPEPIAPKVMRRGVNQFVSNIKDPKYIKDMDDYSKRRTSWMILKSLSATEGLEWDTVKMDDPTTWNNLEDELKSSGFSEMEVGRIVTGVLTANCLNEDHLEQARQRFLASQRDQVENSTSQKVGQKTMLSGEPVNALI